MIDENRTYVRLDNMLEDTGIQPVPLSRIVLGFYTPRLKIDESHVERIVEEIRSFGLINSVLLKRHPSQISDYLVVDGEHRIQACKQLGHTKINARILKISEAEARALALHLNRHTEKRLDVIEEAKAIQKLVEVEGLSQREISKRLAKSQQWVSKRLILARSASDELVMGVTRRLVKPSFATEISRLPVNEQKWMVEKVVGEGLSFRETRFFVDAILANPSYSGEILSKDILEIISPPQDLFEQPDKADWDFANYKIGNCPGCGNEFHVNWRLKVLKWMSKGGR